MQRGALSSFVPIRAYSCLFVPIRLPRHRNECEAQGGRGGEVREGADSEEKKLNHLNLLYLICNNSLCNILLNTGYALIDNNPASCIIKINDTGCSFNIMFSLKTLKYRAENRRRI